MQKLAKKVPKKVLATRAEWPLLFIKLRQMAVPGAADQHGPQP